LVRQEQFLKIRNSSRTYSLLSAARRDKALKGRSIFS